MTLHQSAAHATSVVRSRWVWRRIVRSLVAGAAVALLTFVLIKATRPSLFEAREDRVYEQCAKTGMAVFAFTLLVLLARDRRDSV
jgi:hypothetical protein